MQLLMVVDNPARWPLHLPSVKVVGARDYLTKAYPVTGKARIFNVCRSYRYQSLGYYVSLLAEARGHRPIPDIGTIRDLQSPSLYRSISGDLEDLIQSSLKPLHGDAFELSIYFGRNLAKRYDKLSIHLYNLFRAPLLRARFVRNEKWELKQIGVIGINDVPDSHRDFLVDAATAFFAGPHRSSRKKKAHRFDLAILVNPDEKMPPSNERALARFAKAADRLDISCEIIGRDDFSRLPEFDGLLIRETTYVNNHTYRFSRRAEAEGLVVVDDPESIVKCTNKVYLAELLDRHRVPTPLTSVVHRDNIQEVATRVSMPCILKRPDSSFSAGVLKVKNIDQFLSETAQMLESSDLVLVQEFVPTPFDWRVGVLDGRAIYVCKYFMAGKHWQIIERSDAGRVREGKVETFAVADAPDSVVKTAVRAANLIGRGLYGVDLKEINGRTIVIEINDNPSLDAGYEDRVSKDGLYEDIMRYFLERMESARLA